MTTAPAQPAPIYRCASAAGLLAPILRAHLLPRVRLTVDRWADTRRVLTDDASDQPGPWRTALVPYTRGVMRALTDPAVKEVAMQWASQLGKTEILINYIGWASEEDPAPMMVVYPNSEDAQDFNKDRVMPAIRASPQWKARLSGGTRGERSLKAKQTAFAGGCRVYYRGSNSQAKVRSKPCKHRIGDEIDADEFQYTAVEDMRQRAAAWPGGKQVLASIPSYTGQGIDLELSRSLVHRYHVPCPTCLGYQELRFGQLQWDGGATRPNAGNAAATSRYVCGRPGCGARLGEHHKPWMLARGVWVPAGAEVVAVEGFDREKAAAWAPTPGEEGVELMPGCAVVGAPALKSPRVGFQLSGLYSPWVKWADVARGWCEHDGSPSPGWINGVFGEAYSPKGDKADADQVIKRWVKVEVSSKQAEDASRGGGAYRLGECPPGVLAVTAGIDLQRDRAYVEVRGWGPRCRESWLLWFDTIDAPHQDEAATQREILGAMSRTFARAGKNPVGISRWCLDSGDGTRTAEVYRLARAAPGRGLACKGFSGMNMAQPAKKVLLDKLPDGTALRGGVMLLEVNTWHYKGLVMGKLLQGGDGDKQEGPKAALTPGVSPTWHWPDPDTDAFGNKVRDGVVRYLDMLTSEHLILTNLRAAEKGAQPVRAWRKRPGRSANHFLDACVYNAALAEMEFPLLGVQGMPGSGTAMPRTRVRLGGMAAESQDEYRERRG